MPCGGESEVNACRRGLEEVAMMHNLDGKEERSSLGYKI